MPGKTVLLIALFCFAITVKGSTIHDSHYVAAAVEYSPKVATRLPPLKNTMNNILALDEFMAAASQKGADILLFPEEGLVGYGNKAFYSRIPAPEQKSVPCQDSDLDDMEPISKLSCLAKKYKMYLAVNLPEEYPRQIRCADDGNDFCSSSSKEVFHYNTNVVFDRNGTIIARYRKFHLFHEPDMDVPPTPELVTFDTDFGVTFGTFICFDMLFKEPALGLIREKGVKDILYPSEWISEVPFLTAIQTQAAWAHRLDVNLIASGINYPPRGSTGTGIYHGSQGAIAAFMKDKIESEMIVQSVPKYGHNLKTRPLKKYTASEVEFHSKSSAIWLYQENLQNYTTVLLPQPMNSITVNKRVCNSGLCCDFKLKMSGADVEGNEIYLTENNRSFYRMVVFNGVRDFHRAGSAHSQVCGIVSCKDSSDTSSCGWAPAQTMTVTRFDKIEIIGTFAASNLRDAVHFANIAVGRFQVLSPSIYSLDIQNNAKNPSLSDISLSLNRVSVDNLRTFSIYGWVFKN